MCNVQCVIAPIMEIVIHSSPLNYLTDIIRGGRKRTAV